jgi:cell division transport system permease protein
MRAVSLIPVAAQPMRTLTLAMAVMCYLATLSLGGLMLVEAAVTQWVSGIGSEMTVQVKPLSGTDIAREVKKAREILSATPGIASVRKLDGEFVEDLLEPWLGATSALQELPVPVLLAVAVERDGPPDLKALEQRLAHDVKGASLDTHARWQSELARAAFSMRGLSLAILVLIAVSAMALVIFATRSVLDANRAVVEILHLVGAGDDFIASAVKGRFLRSGFFAGLIGTLGGVLTFALIRALGAPVGRSALAEASTDLLISAPPVALATYTVFLLVPICITLLSLVTAHLAVMRQLRSG